MNEIEPTKAKGTLGDLPVVGKQLQMARDKFEGLRPHEEDDKPTVFAKRAAQGGLIFTATAVAALVII